MNCKICNNSTIDKFVNKFFVVNYCENCKLSETDFIVFQEICLNKLQELNAHIELKTLIYNELQNNFFKYHFGLAKEIIKCSFNDKCMKLDSGCHMFKYTYYGFPLYFCFYKGVIIFNENNIPILMNKLKHKFYVIFIIERIKYNLLKFINKIKKLKNLFVKDYE